MRFRYKIDELERVKKENPENVKQFIINVLEERKSDCTNVNAPLYRAIIRAQGLVQESELNLKKIKCRGWKKECNKKATRNEITGNWCEDCYAKCWEDFDKI